MPVPFTHRLGLMAHEFVDDALVRAGRGKIGRKTVALDMESQLEGIRFSGQLPRRAAHRLPEVGVRRIAT